MLDVFAQWHLKITLLVTNGGGRLHQILSVHTSMNTQEMMNTHTHVIMLKTRGGDRQEVSSQIASSILLTGNKTLTCFLQLGHL